MTIADGMISAITDTPAGSPPAGAVDLSGYVLSPSFVEPHAHLDKAFLSERIPNPRGDLMGAIEGLDNARDTINLDDTIERGRRALELLSRNGVTHVRTHADVTPKNGTMSVEALVHLKNECKHFIDVQVAMLLTWPVTGTDGATQRDLALRALDAGIDVVGGCPHLDPDPDGATDFFVRFATEAGLPIDLHTDENIRPQSRDLDTLSQLVLELGVTTPVTASHCVSLSVVSPQEQARSAALAAEAGVRVVVLPHTNLYLQARGVTSLSPRAIAPVDVLQNAGVRVGAGADNLQDPFNPIGRGDPLETASLLVMASHQLTDMAHHLVSTGAASAIGRDQHTLAVGSEANLVAVRAGTLREAIAMGPPDRIVVYGGVVITDQTRNRK